MNCNERSETLRVRVSAAEKQRVTAAAEAYGGSVSAYLRSLLLKENTSSLTGMEQQRIVKMMCDLCRLVHAASDYQPSQELTELEDTLWNELHRMQY